MGWTDGHEMRGGDCGTGWGDGFTLITLIRQKSDKFRQKNKK
jgi:hypothetical protein